MHKLKQNNAIYRKKGEMAIVCLSKIKINYFEINPDFTLTLAITILLGICYVMKYFHFFNCKVARKI